MLAELSDFRWYVFSGGYKCQDHTYRGRTIRSVIPRWHDEDNTEEQPAWTGNLVERYPMEEEPGLYRVFAGLDRTEEAVLAFANRWGPLESMHELDPDDEDDTMSGYQGDWLDSWFGQIEKMRALTELWDILDGRSEKRMSDVIETDAHEQPGSWWVDIEFKGAPRLRHSFHFRERDRPGFFDALESGGKRELALLCLVDLVNESLWGSCSPFLISGDEPGKVTFHFTPHNLISALWLAFSQEILGVKILKQCQHCRRYFEAVGEGKERRQRSDKKYCSPRCRAAAFKERQGGQG